MEIKYWKLSKYWYKKIDNKKLENDKKLNKNFINDIDDKNNDNLKW